MESTSRTLVENPGWKHQLCCYGTITMVMVLVRDCTYRLCGASDLGDGCCVQGYAQYLLWSSSSRNENCFSSTPHQFLGQCFDQQDEDRMLGHVARSAGDWLVQWSTALLCFLNLGDDPGNAMTVANSGEKPEIAMVAKSWFWQLSHVYTVVGYQCPSRW